MKAKQQIGSAHVIVTVILMVALIGALGFIFWQNFVNKKNVVAVTPATSTAASSKAQISATAPDKYSGWKTYTDSTVGFSFRYPADWQQTTTSTGVAFTSPSTLAATQGSVNGPGRDLMISTAKKSQAPANGSSTAGSILAMQAMQNGTNTSQYFTKEYTETLNSINFTEFNMIAQTPYFSAVFSAGDNYVAADFGMTPTKADMSVTTQDILASFKLN